MRTDTWPVYLTFSRPDVPCAGQLQRTLWWEGLPGTQEKSVKENWRKILNLLKGIQFSVKAQTRLPDYLEYTHYFSRLLKNGGLSFAVIIGIWIYLRHVERFKKLGLSMNNGERVASSGTWHCSLILTFWARLTMHVWIKSMFQILLCVNSEIGSRSYERN